MYYPLYYNEVNIGVKTYTNFTPSGLHFHLSYDNGVCCIIVHDIYSCEPTTVRFFTDINLALRFINNL